MTTYKATIEPKSTDAERAVPRPRPRMGRVMNSQMNVSLPIEMHERLRELAWMHRVPLSHVARELIETGLEMHELYGSKEGEGSGGEGGEGT